MTDIGRIFGKPAPLQRLMQRGEAFFNELNTIDTDDLLVRAKRISNIADTAAATIGERLQHEGDHAAKQLVRAAFMGIGDITSRVTLDTSPDTAEQILTSTTSHTTLLRASKLLKSYAFDSYTQKFKRDGSVFSLTSEGIIFDPEFMFEKSDAGSGCPYAMGNAHKAEYFVECADRIVGIYTEAYRQDLPENLLSYVAKRALMRHRSLSRP